MKIKPLNSAYQRNLLYRSQAPIYKIVQFGIFARRNITDAFQFVCFFPRGDHINPVVLDRKKSHSNGN